MRRTRRFGRTGRAVLGLMAAREEGLELNLLGLSLGVAPSPPTLKLPGLGLVPLLGDG